MIDAKEPAKITNYEQVWNQLLKPYLQTKFLVEPLDALEGADYSAWDKLAFTEPIPAAVEARLAQDPAERGSFFDLRKVMGTYVSINPIILGSGSWICWQAPFVEQSQGNFSRTAGETLGESSSASGPLFKFWNSRNSQRPQGL